MTLFAVLLFALLPLMALIVHTGFVTLTRRQMQTAVNTGAIEGLRFRDELSEPDRRQQVSRLVASLFDDDLTPGNGDPMQFGAGPIVNIEDGETLGNSEFRALTTVSVPDNHAYKPNLELNTDDQRHGDMVAGQWIPGATTHLEGPDDDLGLEPYERHDFIPVGEPGNSSTDAFLVRLRRTRLPDGTAPLLDDDSDVSSTGPTIPFLFGRGGITRAVDDPDPAALWKQRERGTIVRATAIAHMHPAKSVGRRFTMAEIPALTETIDGLTNVVLESDFWSGSGPWASVTWTATGNPNEFKTTVALVTNGSTLELRRTGMAIGRLIDPPDSTTTIGLLNSALDDSPLSEIPRLGIIAILADVDRNPGPGSDQRIVGFGYLKDVVEVIAMPGTYTLTRVDNYMPIRNTSASFQDTAHFSGVDTTDLMSEHLDADLLPTLVGAPTLVRTIQ